MKFHCDSYIFFVPCFTIRTLLNNQNNRCRDVSWSVLNGKDSLTCRHIHIPHSSRFNCNPKGQDINYTPPWQKACMAWQLLSDSPADNAQLSFYFAAALGMYGKCSCTIVCVWNIELNCRIHTTKNFYNWKKKQQISLQDINMGHYWHIHWKQRLQKNTDPISYATARTAT